jgi:uncharacterized membrane protein
VVTGVKRDMHMENVIDIQSEVDPIFEMAAAIETWPAILPHYRSVEVLREAADGRLANMSAWRGHIPVWWQALQVVDVGRKVVSFHHTGGFTKGMEVDWRFQPTCEGGNAVTRVVISHDLAPRRPTWLFEAANRFVGRVFIDYIATKTLMRVKELAEGSSRAPQ